MRPGAAGEIVFGERGAGGTVVSLRRLEVRAAADLLVPLDPPGGRSRPSPGNSLLVTFDLTPSAGGTLLRMTESGFREMGWEAAVLEEQYREHVTGWDFYLPAHRSLRRRRWRARHEPGSRNRRRRRALVGDRRPDAAPDARPAARRGTTAPRRQLGQRLPVTRQAVAKHLAVLDRVGLVRATQAGREKRYQVDQAQLARAAAQLESVGSAWDARLQRIKRIAEAVQRNQEG